MPSQYVTTSKNPLDLDNNFWVYVKQFLPQDSMPSQDYITGETTYDYGILPWYKNLCFPAYYTSVFNYMRMIEWLEWVETNLLNPDKLMRMNATTIKVLLRISLSMLDKVPMPSGPLEEKVARAYVFDRLLYVTKTRFLCYTNFYVTEVLGVPFSRPLDKVPF